MNDTTDETDEEPNDRPHTTAGSRDVWTETPTMNDVTEDSQRVRLLEDARHVEDVTVEHGGSDIRYYITFDYHGIPPYFHQHHGLVFETAFSGRESLNWWEVGPLCPVRFVGVFRESRERLSNGGRDDA